MRTQKKCDQCWIKSEKVICYDGIHGYCGKVFPAEAQAKGGDSRFGGNRCE